MRIERTTLNQSAAGALLAALARGERPDAVNFQQTFSDSLGAVSRRDSGRRDEGIMGDLDSRRQPVERPERDSKPRADSAADQSPRPESAQRTPLRKADETTAQAADNRPAQEARPVAAEAAPAQQGGAESAAAGVTGDASQAAQPVAEAAAATVESVAATVSAAAEAQQVLQLGQIQTVNRSVSTEAEVQTTAQPQPVIEQSANQAALRRQAGVESSLPAANAQAAADDAATAAAGPRQDVVEAVEKRPQDRPAMLQGRRVTLTDESSASRDQAAGRMRAVDNSGLRPQQVSPQQTEARQALQALGMQGLETRADIISMQVVAPLAVDGRLQGEAVEGARPGQIVPAGRIQDIQTGQTERPEAAPRAEQDEQIERITRVIRASLGRGGSRINLQLEPESMGKLRIHMQLRSGELVARFETQNEASKSWLQNGINQLRETLASHGIRLVQATVNSNGADSDGTFLNSGGNQQQSGQTQGDNRQHQPQQHNSATGGQQTAADQQAAVPLMAADQQSQRLNITW